MGHLQDERESQDDDDPLKKKTQPQQPSSHLFPTGCPLQFPQVHPRRGVFPRERREICGRCQNHVCIGCPICIKTIDRIQKSWVTLYHFVLPGQPHHSSSQQGRPTRGTERQVPSARKENEKNIKTASVRKRSTERPALSLLHHTSAMEASADPSEIEHVARDRKGDVAKTPKSRLQKTPEQPRKDFNVWGDLASHWSSGRLLPYSTVQAQKSFSSPSSKTAVHSSICFRLFSIDLFKHFYLCVKYLHYICK